MITLYGYSSDHNEYTGSFEYFLAEGTGLAANSTSIAPPDFQQGFTVIFNEITQVWSVVEDHRGEIVYSTEDKSSQKIDYLGPIRANFTKLKPEQFDTWNGIAWVDMRTDAEKRAYHLASMPELTKRQFNLYLYDHGLKDEVDALLAANPRAKVEFDSTDKVVRTSPTVEAMIALLGWTDEQVDQMWQQVLTL